MKNNKQKNQRFPSYNLFSKDCKGWMRIVEAFISIVLVAIILLIVLNKSQAEGVDFSSNIPDSEVSILRGIQLDDGLRKEILSINPGAGGTEWSSFPAEKVPNYLNCVAKICKIGGSCVLQGYPNKEVYSESVIISANLQTFSPKVLKLFCWEE